MSNRNEMRENVQENENRNLPYDFIIWR